MKQICLLLLLTSTLTSCSRGFYLSSEEIQLLFDEDKFGSIKHMYQVDTLRYNDNQHVLIGDSAHNKFFYVPKDYSIDKIKETELLKNGFPIVRSMAFVPGRDYYANKKVNIRYMGESKNGWRKVKFIVPPSFFLCYLVRGDEYLFSFCRHSDIFFGPYKFRDKHAYYRMIVPIWTKHE